MPFHNRISLTPGRRAVDGAATMPSSSAALALLPDELTLNIVLLVSNYGRYGYARVDERIASLAIHAASTVALFLIETWQWKFPTRILPRHDLVQ